MEDDNKIVVGRSEFFPYHPTYPTYPKQSLPLHKSEPYLCPVCKGNTTMPSGFYLDVKSDGLPDECRSCKGKGIIWS